MWRKRYATIVTKVDQQNVQVILCPQPKKGVTMALMVVPISCQSIKKTRQRVFIDDVIIRYLVMAFTATV